MSDKKKRLDELLTNTEFVRWVRDPDWELDAYWLKWMEANPEKRKEVKLARELIQGLHFEAKTPDSGARQSVLANILNHDNTAAGLEEENRLSLQSARSSIWNGLGQTARVAAILLLVVAASF